MNNSLKERVEKAAGDIFVDWCNDRFGTHYAFSEHLPPPEPDALYVDGDRRLYVEATEVTYDQDAARFEGMNRAGRSDAPNAWSSLKPGGQIVAIDTAFVDSVNYRLQSKCEKHYSHRGALVLHHISRLGGAVDIDRWLARISVPNSHPFSGIYLVASLPEGEASRHLVRVIA
jgi:hypothetical protein